MTRLEAIQAESIQSRQVAERSPGRRSHRAPGTLWAEGSAEETEAPIGLSCSRKPMQNFTSTIERRQVPE